MKVNRVVKNNQVRVNSRPLSIKSFISTMCEASSISISSSFLSLRGVEPRSNPNELSEIATPSARNDIDCHPERSEGSRFFASLRMTRSEGLAMTVRVGYFYDWL